MNSREDSCRTRGSDTRTASGQDGYALLLVLMLLSLAMTLMLGYFSLTMIELGASRSSLTSFQGFYFAEAGLNVRADLVRQAFTGFARPSGTTPTDPETAAACQGSNMGSGDFRCVNYSFPHRTVVTFLEEAPNSANPIVVPRGEQFQNLNGQEYHYVVYSRALNNAQQAEAVLEMHFKSRLIPLFQFAAFYNKDLELLSLAGLLLQGPVHTNGDLYVGSGGTLDVIGQVTVSGSLYRGRKETDTCMAGPVRVIDPENPRELPTCSGSRRLIAQSELTAWREMVKTGVNALALPPADVLDPVAGKSYWDNADLRIMLDLNQSPPEIRVRDVDGSINNGKSVHLASCGVATLSNTFNNEREGTAIEMLDLDVQGMLDCLHSTNMLGTPLDETSDGGLVWYLGVDGPNASGVNNYGVRLTNGAELASTVFGAPAIAGLSIATGQAIYIEGDYNAVNKKPAAVLADSLNVLSNSWTDAAGLASAAGGTLAAASGTTINAAFLAGTDTTGGFEGSAGQSLGGYNGGIKGLMRLHENWFGRTLIYRGSFVSLGTPVHVNGAWVVGSTYYREPTPDYGYDTDFDDALMLPPLSPQFVYLKQELFVRQFEL